MSRGGPLRGPLRSSHGTFEVVRWTAARLRPEVLRVRPEGAWPPQLLTDDDFIVTRHWYLRPVG